MKRNFLTEYNSINLKSSDQEEAEETDLNTYKNCKDHEIWEEFKTGNEKAFQYIYNLYFGQLLNFGIQYIKDAELVKDCIQDLFVDLRIKRSSLPSIKFSIKHYLYKSLRRRIFKKFNHSNGYSLESDFQKFADFEIQVSKEVEMIKNQISIETKQKLDNAINQLPKRQRETLLCYYYEGFTYEEVTSILEYSKIEYARIAVSKAIKHLRKYMLSDKINFISLFLAFVYTF